MILSRDTSAACSARGGSITSRSTPSMRKRTTERASYGSKCRSDARSRSACSSSALIIRITGACVAAVEQVLGRRQILHQPREIASRARSSLQRDRAGAALVVGARELGGEALGVDRARRRAAAAARASARRGRRPSRRAASARRPRRPRSPCGEHAVRRGERVRDPLREARRRRGAWTGGHRRAMACGAGACARRRGRRRGRRRRRRHGSPPAAAACGLGARACRASTPCGGSAGCVGSCQKSRFGRRLPLLLALQVVVALGRERAAVGASCARPSA